MRTILCLAACLVALTGCSTYDATEVKNGRLTFKGHFDSKDITTVEYDGCEYLVVAGSDSNFSMAHKGNCKACRERNR